MTDQSNPPKVLMDFCYPPRSSNPSCIKLPITSGDEFELKPSFIAILPKFSGLDTDNAYLFINEFEDVCAMSKIKQLSEDAIKLRFIPFSLKDAAKKWMYSLTSNSISTWNEFISVFLKKYFPNHKTAQLRNKINQFRQIPDEPFWKYFERFKDLLTQCPHHGMDKWALCQIIYEGLNSKSKIIFESISQGNFMYKTVVDAWTFLEELAEKKNQWENFNDKPSDSTATGEINSIANSISESKLTAALIKRIEILEKQPQNSGWFNCKSSNHVIEDCPILGMSFNNNQEHLNAAFQQQRNDTYNSNNNQDWRNQQNFLWNPRGYQGVQQYQRPNAGQYQTKYPSNFGNSQFNSLQGISNDHEKRINNMEAMMTQVLNVTHQMTNITNSTQQSIQRLEIQINQIH